MASTVPIASLTEALLAVLPGAALVCASDGAVLQANGAARHLLGDAAQTGQPVFEVLDAALVRDAPDSEPFATRVGERLVEVRKATYADGFVLILHTAEAPALVRDVERLALDLTQSVRGPLASIRAAIETLVEYPEMDDALAAQFTTIIHEQALVLSDQLDDAATALGEAVKERHPLEHVPAAALQARTLAVLRAVLTVPVEGPAPPPFVAQVEWPALKRGLAHLATRIVHAVRAPALHVRLGRVGQMAAVDFAWQGAAVKPERLARWAEEPLGLDAAPSSLHDVVERHGGELWAREAEENGGPAIRLLLPLRASAATDGAPATE